MRAFQSILFFAIGVLLLWIDWRGLARGSLPFGSKGFLQTLLLDRNRSATAFWVAFGTYLAAGLAMIGYAAALMAGVVAPIPFSR